MEMTYLAAAAAGVGLADLVLVIAGHAHAGRQEHAEQLPGAPAEVGGARVAEDALAADADMGLGSGPRLDWLAMAGVHMWGWGDTFEG